MAVEPEGTRSRRRPLAVAVGAIAAATTAAAAAVRIASRRGTRVSMSLRIERPVADVFAFVADSRNDLQWLSGAQERRRLSEGPPGVGTRVEAVDRFGPRTITTTEEIVEFEPDRRIVSRVTGAFEGTYDLRVEPEDDATRMTAQMDIRGNGVVGLFDLLPDPVTTRIFERDAARLRELLESRQERHAGGPDTEDDGAGSPPRRVATVKVEAEAETTGAASPEGAVKEGVRAS